MYIERLVFRDFRNYEMLDFYPGKGLNILVGDNAQGKSNLLEGIYILATTKSLRASREQELIRVGQEYGTVAAEVVREKREDVSVEVIFRPPQKGIRINTVRRQRVSDLVGEVNTVFFGLEDIDIIRGEPALRRRFLNLEISQISPQYCYQLACYKRVVEQRNRLLRDLRESRDNPASLAPWDEQLTLYGAFIIERRQEFLERIDKIARSIHSALTGDMEVYQSAYQPSFPLGGARTMVGIRELFTEKLRTLRREEIERGMSLIGPHRDDIAFQIDRMDVRLYGSRGQQRTTALSLKLAEFLLIEETMQEAPVLLLDDVLSELDDRRRNQIFEFSENRCQTFITCTHLRSFQDNVLREASVFDVQQGRVRAA
ncbi:MAG: DNA replication/repair protein RecF [Armatimonadetes bacterium]|nr:DNA replication/repair protein RecF [Armatimonadota bacterium]